MMPRIFALKTVAENRGSLTVIERGVPFPIRRVFYTHHVPVGTVRGKHAHKRSRIALVVVAGACEVSGYTSDGESWFFRLADPTTGLLLDPGDWHQMKFIEDGTVLLCLSSEDYDSQDYIHEPPKTSAEDKVTS